MYQFFAACHVASCFDPMRVCSSTAFSSPSRAAAQARYVPESSRPEHCSKSFSSVCMMNWSCAALPQKKVVASDSEVGLVQVEAAVMAKRKVHLLPQNTRVQNDEWTFSKSAQRRKDKERQVKRNDAILTGNWPAVKKTHGRKNFIKVNDIELWSLKVGLQLSRALRAASGWLAR